VDGEVSATMLAVRHEAWGQMAALREVPVPVPAGDGVLLKVTAAGICHSDLLVMDSPPGRLPYELPMTLGHEVAGTVVEVGSSASEQWLGRDVVVHGVWGCGQCRRCARGRENYCLRRPGAVGNGLGRDGGLAEYMVVPSPRYLVDAAGLDPVQAAPLTDAALTAFHALRPLLDTFDEESRVLVLGAGGLGHFAVQLIARTGARLVVVDPKPDARELAVALGAQRVVADLGQTALVADAPEDRFDAVYDFVGTADTVAASLCLLAPGGASSVVGGAGGSVLVGKDLGLPQGWSVSAPFWGPKADLAAVLDLAREGRLRAHVETFPLADALTAYRRLHHGDVRGRAVVRPHA
jgi:propanol-preferring alcohol dehydrogenase